MKGRWAALGAVVLVAAAMGALGALWAGERAERRRVAGLLASYKAQRARVDTVYRQDTVRLWRAVARWDTLVLGVPPAIGTTTATEWTPRERLLIATGGEAIASCRVAIATCEERVAASDSIIAALEAQGRCRLLPGVPCPPRWALFVFGVGLGVAARR